MSPILPPSLADGTGEPSDSAPEAVPPTEVTAQQVRQMKVSEFAAWLRTQTKHKRPFQEQTIHDYSEATRGLDRCLASEEGDRQAAHRPPRGISRHRIP